MTMPGPAGRLVQRPRVGGLGAVRQPVELAANHHDYRDERDDRRAAQDPVDRRVGPLQRVTGQVRRQRVDPGPDDAARRVGGQEDPPAHLAHAGQERGVRAQHRHEPAEEHHRHAVPVEQVPGRLQLPLVEPHLRPVPPGQPVAALVTEPVADVVTDDRRRRGHQPDHPRRQLVRVPGVGTRNDQRRLTGQRHAQALGRHQQEQHPVAIGGDQVTQIHSGNPRWSGGYPHHRSPGAQHQ
jgi:hypothetical protein